MKKLIARIKALEDAMGGNLTANFIYSDGTVVTKRDHRIIKHICNTDIERVVNITFPTIGKGQGRLPELLRGLVVNDL